MRQKFVGEDFGDEDRLVGEERDDGATRWGELRGQCRWGRCAVCWLSWWTEATVHAT